MERVIEELDEAKAEIEKLRADLKCKAELAENLKRAHHEQTVQIQQSKSIIERQTQELNAKAEEISVARKMCDELQCRLNEKDSIVKRLSSTNDKLRVDCEEVQRKWEDERRGLVMALDEANEKNIDQEQKIHVYMAEIEGLKGLLSASQSKCLEAEKKAKALKELRERDDVLLKVEEQNRTLLEQLKWKKEQFKHLEEAHDKLQSQFKESQKEWELEKSTLIDGICSLQTSLDSEKRISEDTQNRLKICNQALAHEESRRKYMEVELGDYKARYDTVFFECKDTKSQLESLTTQRDKEIAALRHSLGTKETFHKEIAYRAGKLEQENQELLESLKELREAQIQEAGNSSSVAKLRNKLRSVEQMHRDSSANLKAKEAEWSSQLVKLSEELNDYKFALESKETEAKELKMELGNCHSAIMQLELQNQEASVMLLVLKSYMCQLQLEERALNIETDFKETLREVSNALDSANSELCEEREKTALLSRKVDSFNFMEEKQHLMQIELDRYKQVLEESTACQVQLRKQALQKENEFKEKLQEVSDALSRADSELERYKQVLEESTTCQVQLRKQALQKENGFKEKLQEVSDALSRADSELERYKQALEESTTCQLQLQKQALQKENEYKEKLQEVLDALSRADSELERYKQLLEESTACQLQLQKQALQKENEFKEKLREVPDALIRADSELERYKQALEESNTCQLQLQKQALQKENEYKEKLQEVSDAFSRADSEVERYKQLLEESTACQLQLQKQALQKENGFKEKLREVSDALSRAESEVAAKIYEGHAVEFERWLWESIVQRLKHDLEKDQALRKELEYSLLAQIEVGENVKKENNSLQCQVVESWEKISAAEILVQLEIEEKKLIILELEDNMSSIEQKSKEQEMSLSFSQQQAMDIEAKLEAKQMEMKSLTNLSETKLRTLEALVDELKIERINLVEDIMKLSTERESLMDCVVELSDVISQFSDQDVQLAETLEKIVHESVVDGSTSVQDSKFDTMLVSYAADIENAYRSPTRSKSFQAVADDRSPFRELN
ncbi:uncharacterized protein At4g38062 [Mercurialis annua]|uniref:uncharacterized protein At4g38062 n=1 Tax=Mercurialis annua TaxID=3986 RepID=UPI00215F8465|nr:uncharacterized protein At4g38062 [Mercurialis annua]